MKYYQHLLLCALLCAALPFFTAAASGEHEGGHGDEHDGDEAGFVEKMSRLQYFTHKADLSLRANNFRLADFYLHEMEEVIEEITEVNAYHGYPVGELAEKILLPSFEKLENAVDERGANAHAVFLTVIESCNACHQKTEHDFIKIESRGNNPFLQSFGK